MKGFDFAVFHQNARRKRTQLLKCVCGGLLFSFFCAMCWRAFHGFDWSDEAYYSSIVYRLIQGDALFKTSWDIHQLSAIILVPLYWIYTSIFGTTGIILFSRIVYLLVVLVESIWSFIKFSKKCGALYGTLVSILLLGYSCVTGLSYNTMMMEAFIMAILLLPAEENKHLRQTRWRKERYVLSGFFSGIAVQAYPSTILALILFVIYIVRSEEKKALKMLLYYILGGVIVFLLFSIFLMINSSFEAAIQNAKYLFVDPEHGEIAFSIRDHFLQLKDLIDIKTGYALILANCMAIVTWFTKGRIATFFSWISGLFLILSLFFQWDSIRAGYGKSSIQYQLYFSIALCFPCLWFLNKCKWNSTILLYQGGFVGSIGVNIATNNNATFYVYPYLISAIGTVIYASQLIRIRGIRRERIIKSCAYTPVAALIIFAFVSSFAFVYRDGELKTLDTRMKNGPAAGIYTTEQRAKQYEETIEAISTYMPTNGNVLYVKLLPFGYLCSNARPATPRLWRTNLDYPMFEEYYLNNPDKLPDAIYIVNENYGITNDGIKIGEYMQNHIETTPHRMIELDCATIFLFIGGNNDEV